MRKFLFLFALTAALCGCSDGSVVTGPHADAQLDAPTPVDAGLDSEEVFLPPAATPCQTAAQCQYPGLKALCLLATCDLDKGQCKQVQADDGSVCVDSNACAQAGLCQNGLCNPGSPVNCNDNNPCTMDSCTVQNGCEHTNVAQGSSCNDGVACTEKDGCVGGTCKGTPVNCDDNNVCTSDSCNTADGSCVHAAVNGPCTDNDVCTTETCANGACASSPISCDDGNECTADLCGQDKGCYSVNLGDGSACTDNNVCTINDACKNGSCAPGTPENCDDNDVCTLDSCNAVSGCLHNKSAAITCDDGDKCTQNDYCGAAEADGAWKCIGGKLLVCDDGNACTDDSCTLTGGCSHTPNNGACDDGNVCTTGDTCYQTSCQAGKVQKCDDNNACTTDTCTALTGCVFSANTDSCNDDSLCTTDNVCSNKVCVGTPVTCNDNNPCTKDTCDPAKGCQFAKLSAGSECNDSDPCTASDVCDGAGKCAGKTQVCNDGNSCTTDKCQGGNCDFMAVANNTPCSDSDACTVGDGCITGVCLPGELTPCNDNNPCTKDSCNPTTGKCGFVKIPGC